MANRQEVVVVDGLPETAEVLRAVFEPQGISVSRRAATTRPSKNSSGVIVLHESSAACVDGPRVLVGRITSDAMSCRELPQPFHYADLIAAIDEIVALPAA